MKDEEIIILVDDDNDYRIVIAKISEIQITPTFINIRKENQSQSIPSTWKFSFYPIDSEVFIPKNPFGEVHEG